MFQSIKQRKYKNQSNPNLSQTDTGGGQTKQTTFSFIIVFGCGKFLSKHLNQSLNLSRIFIRIEIHHHSKETQRKKGEEKSIKLGEFVFR